MDETNENLQKNENLHSKMKNLGNNKSIDRKNDLKENKKILYTQSKQIEK